jgi:hypothetical protein
MLDGELCKMRLLDVAAKTSPPMAMKECTFPLETSSSKLVVGFAPYRERLDFVMAQYLSS